MIQGRLSNIMLNIYCWSCGSQISEKEILGLGHFDQKIGKYQGKAFVTFKCDKCQKVRYQIMNNNLMSKQKNSIKKYKNSNNNSNVTDTEKEIDINQVINFFETLNDINTIDNFLNKCKTETSPVAENGDYQKTILQPLDVYNLYNKLNKSYLKRLMILTLNQNNYPVTWEFLGEGLNKQISYEPKVIFYTPFLLEEKVSIIIAENIDDNNKKPSQNNINKTKKLIRAGKILGIELIDHIVINKSGYQSYDELNLI